MPKRLTFREFNDLLESRRLPPEMIVDYVDFDDRSAIPRLVFRSDALLDVPPDDYDVDQRIYLYDRELRQQTYELEDALTTVARVEVVAEGDSWFNLPRFWRPPAIADQLAKRKRLRVKNIAYWGHTLHKMLEEREYLDEMSDATQYFLLSAGGNDLQNGLEGGEAIYEYDPHRPLDDYLTDSGLDILRTVHNGYVTLLSEVIDRFPSVQVLTHGYDYPRPLVGKGKYIGQYLRRKNIPNEKMQEVIDPIINRLNSEIAAGTSVIASATYLNCRTVTSPFTWYDDMHPEEDGFGAVADKFDEQIS